MNDKKIIIITASIVIPIVIFGVFMGIADLTKEDKINPHNLPIVNTHHSYMMLSFEDSIKRHDLSILATVQSVETKIEDESYHKIKHVLVDNHRDILEDAVEKFMTEKITRQEFDEIQTQLITGETYEEYLENKIPYRYITLKVDQYFVDRTGHFADTIVVRTSGEGQGVRDNIPVYYPNSYDIQYLVGEQAIYVIEAFSVLQGNDGSSHLVYESPPSDYDLLILWGFTGKFSIDDNNMVQSKFNKYMLNGKVSDSQVTQILEGILTTLNNESVIDDPSIMWNLPIPFDDALVRATQTGDELTLILQNQQAQYGE